jgi:aerobic-type carbon monoxide dehydrogenase small subunit (CoxS/CutS family)
LPRDIGSVGRTGRRKRGPDLRILWYFDLHGERISLEIIRKEGYGLIEQITFRINGKPMNLKIDGNRRLLWVLRTDLALTGTKCGCGEGHCGACTVLIDNKAHRSCQISVREIEGKEMVTIEGLAGNGRLHPRQQAFVEHGALQCGFCTPGMILNAYSLLLENPRPTEAEIRAGMENNLCRCGAHGRIIQAVQSAAKELAGRSRG